MAGAKPPPGAVNRWQRCPILMAIWSFAVAQPIYHQMGTHAVFLSDIGAAHQTLWTIVLAVSLLLPGLLCGLCLVCGLVVRGSERWLFMAAQAVLWLLLALQLTRAWPALLGLPACLAFTGLLTWLGERSVRMRQFLSVCALGAVVFPAMFVNQKAIRPLAWRRAGATTTATRAGNPVPVVMIVFDEFSGASLWTEERNIDAKLFPNFAQLAEEGTWYRNATSVHGDTNMAVPSILSGLYPPETIDAVFDSERHLFSVLIDEHGYDGLVLEPVTRLCESTRLPEIMAPLPPVFPWGEFAGIIGRAYAIQLVPIELAKPGFPPPLPYRWFGVGYRRVDTTATRGIARHAWNRNRDVQLQHFLDGLTPSNDPTLYFLHVVLPHVPYAHDATGARYASEQETSEIPPITEASGLSATYSDGWQSDPLIAAQHRRRYLWQVQYADRFIGQVRDRLIESQIYDKCLLIVMADHGVSIRPRDSRRTTSPTNLVDILSIPLFIKPPGTGRGGISNEPAESIDVFPTIVDVLKVPDPPAADGNSLVSGQYRARPSKRFLDSRGLRVLPADFPRSVPRSMWPVLSADVEPQFLALSDPQKLTGRSVADFTAGPPADVQIEVLSGIRPDQAGDPAGPLCFTARTIDPARNTNTTRLALAFDGRIAAVTRTVGSGSEDGGFQFLIPADRHRTKIGRAELFVVENAGDQIRLRMCAWHQSR